MKTYEIPDLDIETQKVYPIRFISTVLGNYTLPMPSDYKFELKKVYVTEPSRSNSGAITSFPDKFFVPYFTVTWNVIKFSDYSTLMRLIQVDEVITEYYDTNEQRYKQAKFYVQQPTYNKLYTMQMQYHFVTGLQLIFAGTMNDIDELKVEYNANGGLGSIPSITGYSGDEFVVSDNKDEGGNSIITKAGYILTEWNTMPNGSGDKYALGSTAVITYNMQLYAQWTEV